MFVLVTIHVLALLGYYNLQNLFCTCIVSLDELLARLVSCGDGI